VRGVKIRQHLEQVYNWSYLALAVDGVMGKLWWQWIPNMKKASIQMVVETWQKEGVAALVWDRAPSHRAQVVRAVGLPLIEQPAYSPELNPAERVFEELRRAVEGRVYGSIDKKIAAVEAALEDLAATPERVQSLAGWSWIRNSLNLLQPSHS
jgi:transposase